MTTERDLGRALDQWLAAGVDQVNDRVLDELESRIARQRQRPAWRISWRDTHVTTYAKLAAGLAAVLVVAFVGWRMLPGTGATGGQPTPIPTPSAAPSTTPTPSGTSAPRTGNGHVQGQTLRFTYAAPSGWTSEGWAFIDSLGSAGPNGIGVAASGAVNVPTDPCDGIGKVSDAQTAQDVLVDLRARHDLVVSDPHAATVGGLSGIRVDVAVPADLSACRDLYFVFAEPDGSGIYAQGPSNLFDLWILDAEGGPIWVLIEHFAGTPATDYAEAQAIVDSIVFTP